MTRFNGDTGLNFFEMVNDAVVVWEPEEEIILQANRCACEMYGVDPEDFIGTSLRRFVVDVERGLEEIAYLLKHKKRHNYKTVHRRADGEELVILMNSSVFETDDGPAILSVLRDVTEHRVIEQKLQQKKAELEAIFRSIPDSVVFTDTEWNIVTVNPAFVNAFGYEHDEVVGRGVHVLQDGIDGEYEAESDGEGLTAREGEVQYRRKNGELFVGERVAVRVADEEGRHLGYLFIIQDVSAQREAEQRLWTSEQKLSLFVRRSPLAFIEWSVEGEVNEWNPAAQEIFGYTRQEAFRRHLSDLVVPEHLQDKVEETWAALIGRTGGEHIIVENICKDGSTITCEWYNTTLVDEKGHVMGVASLARDITEQERIENELRQSEARYRNVVNSIKEVIFQTNAEGQWTFLNEAWTEITGYSVEESLGTPFHKYIHPDDRQRNRELFEPLFRQEVDYVRHEVRYLTKEGSVRWVEVFTRLILDEDGNLVGTTGTCMDITERKEAEVALRKYADELEEAKEEAEAATRAKSEFLANMSHEIRTPLNGVIGMTSLLLETELTDDQRDFIETIRTSGDALMTIINDILDFSKIEAGMLDLEEQPFGVRQCVEEALDLVAPQAAAKGLELAYFVEDEVPVTVKGDITRVRQVLVNLLSNAVKFTEDGEVFVHVDAERRGNDSSRGYEIIFSVEDTGIGIPEDRLDTLFDSFSQVDASTTRKYGGTGLGLAICNLLTQMMGGTIDVESTVEEGSVFTFSIQAEAVDAPLQRYLRPEQPSLKGRRALVVDDNSVNRRILLRLCEKWGMEIVEAGSGPEALDLLDEDPRVDVILLDMQMPEMDGNMLASEIGQRYISGVPPMLMITSLGQDPSIDVDEVVATLHKPLKPSQLYNALVDLFHDHSSTHGNAATAQSEQDQEELADTFVSAEGSRPMRILLAEDNPVNQKVAVTMLDRLGYRADVVANGVETIEALRTRPYDLILMDIQMPELDGLEATQRIRKEFPEDQQPTIIAMTANAMIGDRERCLEVGMNDYLSKPVRTDELRDVLRKYGGLVGVVSENGARSESAPDAGAASDFAAELRRRVAQFAGADDPEFICEIIEDFLDNTPKLVDELREGIKAQDFKTIERASHTLKASSSMFGGEELATRCEQMEDKACRKELEHAEQQFAVIDQLHQRFTEQCRAALDEIRK